MAAVAAGLVLLTLAALSPVLFNDFVRYDDHLYIAGNPLVSRGLTGDGARRALTATDQGNWFPLTWLSHMLDVELYGLDPRGHHLTNLLLHAASTLLLWAALRAMTGASLPGALVAALFAVHPLHVESVAWAAERKDVLAGFFWMLALVAHARHARRPGAGRYLAVAACLACALASKATAVTLPFALLLLDWWPLGRWGRGRGSAAAPLLEKLPLLALSAAASVATFRAQEAAGTVAAAGLSTAAERVSTATLAYASYLAKTLWPHDLSVFYHYHMHRGGGPGALLAGAALLGVTALALAAWRRGPWLATGWLWYLGTLVPMAGFVQAGVQSMADRYTYLPLVGVFLAAAWQLAALAGGSVRRRRAAVAAVAATFLLAACSFAQARLWRDTRRLFANALRVDPANVDARLILAGALAEQGAVREADEQLAAALRLSPALPGVNAQIGYDSLLRGERGEAERRFRAELAVAPTAKVHRYLAVTLLQGGRRGEAKRHYLEAVRLQPAYFPARKELGLLLAGEGAWAEALEHLREAERLEPADALVGLRHREARMRLETLRGR